MREFPSFAELVAQHLEPHPKEKGRWICPLCKNGGKITVKGDNGINCWKNDSDGHRSEIIDYLNQCHRDVNPQLFGGKNQPRATGFKKKAFAPRIKLVPAAIPAVPLKLARLATLPNDIPEYVAESGLDRNEKQVDGRAIYYHYGKAQQVRRFEWQDESLKGWDKLPKPQHFNGSKWITGKGSGDWMPYRFDEVLAAAATSGNAFVLSQEGEKAVELGRLHKIPSFSFQGGSWGEKDLLKAAQEISDRGLVWLYLCDHDQAGKDKGEKIRQTCMKAKCPCIVIHAAEIYPEIQDKGDIEEILEAMSAEEFVEKVEELAGRSGEEQPDREPTDEDLEIEENAQTLTMVNAMSGVDLDIEAGLYGGGGQLAKCIRLTAHSMRVDPNALITHFIAAAAGLIGGSSRIVIKASANYVLMCILRTCNVAKTGRKKSPMLDVIFQPMNQLEEELALVWEAEKQSWEASKDKDGKTKEAKPTEPVLRITDANVEGLINVCQENPRGVTVTQDELSAFWNGRNKTRSGGKGDDKEYYLSEFNGSYLRKTRKGEEGRAKLSRSTVSRTGSTQFSTIRDLMGNHADNDGEFARWLVCVPRYVDGKIDLFDEDDAAPQLKKLLHGLYVQLHNLPFQDYLLSAEAKKIWQACQHSLIDWQETDPSEGIQAAIPKLETYIGRIALVLHCVNACLDGRTPEPSISAQTMKAAVQWMNFYAGQLLKLYSLNGALGDDISKAKQIDEWVQGKGGTKTVKDIQEGKRFEGKKRMPIANLRRYLKLLVDSGLGETIGNDTYHSFGMKEPKEVGEFAVTPVNSLANTLINEPLDKGEKGAKGENVPPSETSALQGFEAKRGKGGDVLHFSPDSNNLSAEDTDSQEYIYSNSPLFPLSTSNPVVDEVSEGGTFSPFAPQTDENPPEAEVDDWISAFGSTEDDDGIREMVGAIAEAYPKNHPVKRAVYDRLPEATKMQIKQLMNGHTPEEIVLAAVAEVGA
jgi:Protein of unknown function (DUF3987)